MRLKTTTQHLIKQISQASRIQIPAEGSNTTREKNTKGPRPYNKQVTKDGAGGDCGSNRDGGFWRRGKTGRRDGNVPSALSNFGEGPKKHGFANVCDNVKSKEVRKELLKMWPQVPRPWDANQYSELGQGQARQIQTSAAREERRLKERF